MHKIPVTAVILAGGLGKRIGGDKGLQLLHGRVLLSWVLNAVCRDSQIVFINANDAQGAYANFGCRVIADLIPDWPGPLAGLHAALSSADTEYVLTVPCDTPFLPNDLPGRLLAGLTGQGVEAAVAMAGGRRQPAIALYHKRVLPKLVDYLASGGRKVNDWLNSLRLSEVAFDNVADFENINTQDELNRANRMPVPARCTIEPGFSISARSEGDQEVEDVKTAGTGNSIMNTQKVIGFAGFSGSGKTTLLEKVIPLLTARGLRISVIKHAHHKFDIDKPGKDSFRHREAGAGEVLVVSGYRWALMHELVDEAEPTLENLCSRLAPCDLVIVEGYKYSAIPKIEVHRGETGHPHLYHDDKLIVALATDTRSDITLPQFDINKPQQVAEFIFKYFSFN